MNEYKQGYKDGFRDASADGVPDGWTPSDDGKGWDFESGGIEAYVGPTHMGEDIEFFVWKDGGEYYGNAATKEEAFQEVAKRCEFLSTGPKDKYEAFKIVSDWFLDEGASLNHISGPDWVQSFDQSSVTIAFYAAVEPGQDPQDAVAQMLATEGVPMVFGETVSVGEPDEDEGGNREVLIKYEF